MKGGRRDTQGCQRKEEGPGFERFCYRYFCETEQSNEDTRLWCMRGGLHPGLGSPPAIWLGLDPDPHLLLARSPPSAMEVPQNQSFV